MSRLITFGDSFTYGHGLADCHVAPDLAGTNPSELAWPALLGNKLGMTVVNESKPGNSNIEILRDILNFKDILPTDLVVVGWTFVVRDYIFKKNLLGFDTSFKVSPWTKDTGFIKNWLSVHNNYDLSIRSGLNMHHASCFLKTKNVQQYHFCAHQELFDVMPEFTLVPENFIDGKILPRIDKAFDNSHPGPLSHQQAANKLYETINESK
jgi:hypothetical protein